MSNQRINNNATEENKEQEPLPNEELRKIFRKVFSKRTADLLWDLIIIGVSITDILCDILVTIEFYTEDRLVFFAISAVIFCLAQLSYSFLFTATWARELKYSARVVVFFLVLPLGQLVPFFTWLESFHLKKVDSWITYFKLRPTDQITVTDDEDSLWTYIQVKYQAHSGFLVEAFVEAVPQCILQTIAVILARNATTLNVLSIVISLIVISSKGFLISYSINRPTFFFNLLAIAADCFGLFATASWLFFNDAALLSTSWWLWVTVPGCLFSAVGGWFLLWFAIFDDHLKSLTPKLGLERGMMLETDSLVFELYIIRVVAWILAVIPAIVLYVTAKFAIIPIFLFKSIDPEHAYHSTFYKKLFAWLNNGSQTQKLYVANTFFALAKKRKRELVERLNSVTNKNMQKMSLLLFIKEVGMPKERFVKVGMKRENSNENFAHTVLTTYREANEAEARKEISRLKRKRETMHVVRDVQEDVHARSLIINGIRSREVFKRESYREMSCCSAVVRILGTSCFLIAGLCGICWVPFTLAFALYNLVLPILQIHRCVQSSDERGDLGLQCSLSWLYLFTVALLLLLVRPVYKFQKLWKTELLAVQGFPGIFYGDEVLAELTYRFSSLSILIDKFGWGISSIICTYLGG